MTASTLMLNRFAIFIGGISTTDIASNASYYLDLAVSPPQWYIPNLTKQTTPLPAITGHVAVPIENRILLLFGVSQYSPTSVFVPDPVGWFDAETGEYSVVKTNLKRGSGRVGHTAVYDEESENVYVFGGIDETGALVTQLWILAIKSMTWSQSDIPSSAGAIKTGLVGASSILVNKMIVTCFGAQNSSAVPVNECSLYSISSSSWIPSQRKGNGPVGRSATNLSLLPNKNVFVFGGADYYNRTSFNDSWVLNVNTLPTINWSPRRYSSVTPLSSSDYGMVEVDDGYFIIWGGRSKTTENNPTGTLGVFDLRSSANPDTLYTVNYVVPAELIQKNTQKDNPVTEFVKNNLGLSVLFGMLLVILMGFIAFVMIFRVARIYHRKERKFPSVRYSNDGRQLDGIAGVRPHNSPERTHKTDSSKFNWFGLRRWFRSDAEVLETLDMPQKLKRPGDIFVEKDHRRSSYYDLQPIDLGIASGGPTNRNSVYSVLESSSKSLDDSGDIVLFGLDSGNVGKRADSIVNISPPNPAMLPKTPNLVPSSGFKSESGRPIKHEAHDSTTSATTYLSEESESFYDEDSDHSQPPPLIPEIRRQTQHRSSFIAEVHVNHQSRGLGLRIGPMKPKVPNECVDGPMVEWNPPTTIMMLVPAPVQGEEDSRRGSVAFAVGDGVAVEVEVTNDAQSEFNRWVTSAQSLVKPEVDVNARINEDEGNGEEPHTTVIQDGNEVNGQEVNVRKDESLKSLYSFSESIDRLKESQDDDEEMFADSELLAEYLKMQNITQSPSATIVPANTYPASEETTLNSSGAEEDEIPQRKNSRHLRSRQNNLLISSMKGS